MLLDVVLGSKSVWRVLVVMMEAPGKRFSASELYTATRLGGSSMTRVLSLLMTHGLIKEDLHGRAFYYVNNVHPLSDLVRKLCDQEREYLNNLPWEIVTVLREFVRGVLSALPVTQVLLFGSQARHTARSSSDIDIAVIGKHKLKTKDLLQLTEISQKLEKRFHVKIQTHYFTEEQFAKKGDPLIWDIEKDGIRLVKPRQS